ncbi:Precorrin-2 dehydrogenase [[Eubacterium] infirmum]|nr:Precorrin-2 dehydrogenase [[Eubacterium] infirmum]
MNRFPLCINLEDKSFVVVGSGRIAMRKLAAIRQFTDKIKIITKEPIKEDLYDGIKIERKTFDEDDLEGADFVITATGSRERDEAIVAFCKAKGIPVNAADDREECDFFLPGIVKRGELVVSVSTTGKSPAYSRYLREQIEDMLPDNIEAILDILGDLRKKLPSKVDSQQERSRIYKYVMLMLLKLDDINEVDVDKIIEAYYDGKIGFSD